MSKVAVVAIIICLCMISVCPGEDAKEVDAVTYQKSLPDGKYAYVVEVKPGKGGHAAATSQPTTGPSSDVPKYQLWLAKSRNDKGKMVWEYMGFKATTDPYVKEIDQALVLDVSSRGGETIVLARRGSIVRVVTISASGETKEVKLFAASVELGELPLAGTIITMHRDIFVLLHLESETAELWQIREGLENKMVWRGDVHSISDAKPSTKPSDSGPSEGKRSDRPETDSLPIEKKLEQ